MTGFYKSYASAMDLHVPSSRLGAPTNPMVAKQLEEFGKLLNQGIKNIEIGTISADKFEQIPQQHFDEVRRLAHITDSKVSVHAPLLDLAGFPTGGEGGAWKEEQRASTEQQVFSILERTYKLSNGENVPVVFHAGHIASQEYGVPYDPVKHPDGLKKLKTDEEGRVIIDSSTGKPIVEGTPFRAIYAVNQDTGQLTRLDYEEKYHIGREGKEIWDPFRRLESLNKTQWDEEKLKILSHQKDIGDLKEKIEIKLRQNKAIKDTGLETDPKYQGVYETNLADIELVKGHLNEINRRLGSAYEDVHNKFQRFAGKEEKEVVGGVLKQMNKIYKEKEKEWLEKNRELEKIKEKLIEAKEREDKTKVAQLYEEYGLKELDVLQSQLEQSKGVVTSITKMPTPELWRYVGEFAIEKTSDTVSGAIAKMYAKLKKEEPGSEKKTPFIALENFFVNSPMSRAEDLREAVLLSRKKLAEKLKKEANLSENEAKKEAEKLIGATWDVGHINNLRKAGYEGEELKKEVLEDTKKIADLVKHVHITDNFGFFDSHLPPGMGNVPIREIMEQLEKTWAKEQEAGRLHQAPRGIVEAGGFVAEIGQNPTVGILEYFGSPMFKMAPSQYFWATQKGGTAHTYSPYNESFIEFPSQHFNLYGSSFTTLPKTVGGQVGGEASRFSGTPNQ